MIQKFTKLNGICNEFEDRHVKGKIMEQLYKLSKFLFVIITEFYKYEDENINLESYSDDRRACCASPLDCRIF